MDIHSTSTAIADVIAERCRQMDVEGWSPEHDDTHDNFEMARAGAFYALHTAADALPEPSAESPSDRYGLFLTADQAWPPGWGALWRKPKDARRNLVRAAALLLAEIERLDRETERRQQKQWAAQGKRRRDAAAKSIERKIREMGK